MLWSEIGADLIDAEYTVVGWLSKEEDFVIYLENLKGLNNCISKQKYVLFYL